MDLNSNANRPDVSVVVLTYYHENYIAEALESVLSQKTEYTFEIVVCDDCSKDGTRAILELYAAKYPDIIRVYFNECNLGISRNLYQARCYCRGRYICTLSGDDFWLSDRKIQVQACFLDANPDVFGVATSLRICPNGQRDYPMVLPKKEFRNKTLSLDEYLNHNCFGTGTVMMKNVFFEGSEREAWQLMVDASQFIDDGTDAILMLQHGDIFALDFCAYGYRVQTEKAGRHNFNSIHTPASLFEKSVSMYNYLDDNLVPHVDLMPRYVDMVSTALPKAVIARDVSSFKRVYAVIPDEYKERNLKAASSIMMLRKIGRKVLSMIRMRVYLSE